MLEIKLNLLGDMSIIRRQKRVQFLLISIFSALCLFSLLIIVHTYQTNQFIYRVNKKEINKISQKLTAIHPKLDRIIFLDQKLKKNTNAKLYQQTKYRPQNWFNKLALIAMQTPNDIILENLKVHVGKNEKETGKIELKGIMDLDQNIPDIQQLNRFKAELERYPYFMDPFHTIEITRSRINHRDAKPVLSFAMEIK